MSFVLLCTPSPLAWDFRNCRWAWRAEEEEDDDDDDDDEDEQRRRVIAAAAAHTNWNAKDNELGLGESLREHRKRGLSEQQTNSTLGPTC